MKVYKKTTFGKYRQIFEEFLFDCTAFIILPYSLSPIKPHIKITFLCMIFILIMYFKKDRTNYPFFVELYGDRIRIRYYKDKFLQPFFMAKFIDITIEFKDIKDIKYDSIKRHGSIYFFLKNKDYYYFTSINDSTVFKIYKDLEQALKEYRENEQLDKIQL